MTNKNKAIQTFVGFASLGLVFTGILFAVSTKNKVDSGEIPKGDPKIRTRYLQSVTLIIGGFFIGNKYS